MLSVFILCILFLLALLVLVLDQDACSLSLLPPPVEDTGGTFHQHIVSLSSLLLVCLSCIECMFTYVVVVGLCVCMCVECVFWCCPIECFVLYEVDHHYDFPRV